METYTLTVNEVKLEVFRGLIEELKKVRVAQGEKGNAGDSEVLHTLAVVFDNCFNKAKDSIEND